MHTKYFIIQMLIIEDAREATEIQPVPVWLASPPVSSFITKTCLYNVDPLKPHFYIVKLGFTGVYTIFHISAQNIDCGTR